MEIFALAICVYVLLVILGALDGEGKCRNGSEHEYSYDPDDGSFSKTHKCLKCGKTGKHELEYDYTISGGDSSGMSSSQKFRREFNNPGAFSSQRVYKCKKCNFTKCE